MRPWVKHPSESMNYINTDILAFRLIGYLCHHAAPRDETRSKLRLKKGQLVTSDRILAAALKEDSHKLIARKLKKLADDGLITLVRERMVGTLITVSCIAYVENDPRMTHAVSKNDPQNDPHSSQLNQHVKPVSDPCRDPQMTHAVSKNGQTSIDIDKNKREREGRGTEKAAEAAGSPSHKFIKTGIGEGKESIGEGLAPPEASHSHLNEVLNLARDWYGYLAEFAPSLLDTEFEIGLTLEMIIAKGWELKKLALILKYLKSRPSKSQVSMEWFSPKDFQKKLFGRPYIEVAYAEAIQRSIEMAYPARKDVAEDKLKKSLRAQCEKYAKLYDAEILEFKKRSPND